MRPPDLVCQPRIRAVPAARRKKGKKKKKPLLSPFRYPGGKSWLKPVIEHWLNPPVEHLVEAFAGGANVTIAALVHSLASRATMIEIDPNVAAVWMVILDGQAEWLGAKIKSFRLNRTSLAREFEQSPEAVRDVAWTTLLRNRVSHGGIITTGAGVLNRGEDGRGLKSRWYAKTLRERITGINALRDKITFLQQDAITWLADAAANPPAETTAYFIDPPYATAGKRLYTHSAIDHARLFELGSRLSGRVLMTYEDTKEVRDLAQSHGFDVRNINMQSRQNRAKTELLIARNFSWLKNEAN